MIDHIPNKPKKAIVVNANNSKLLTGATCISFYPVDYETGEGDTLSKDIILCQLGFLISNKMSNFFGKEYTFRFEQLRKAHFTWLSVSQIQRIVNELATGDNPFIKTTKHNGAKNSYELLPKAKKLFQKLVNEKKEHYIGIYPALIESLIPKKPSPKVKVADYDPNHYGATAVQQAIILSRIQYLVGNRKDIEDKKFVRSFTDLYNQFFTFIGYSTFLKAIKALEHRGLLRVSTVGKLELESKYTDQTRVIEINYELLQKSYLPFLKPVVYSYSADQFEYSKGTSKKISYNLEAVEMVA